MSERIFLSLPVGGVVLLEPGEIKTVTSEPQKRQFWPMLLIGNQSDANGFLLNDLMVGNEHVPLSPLSKEMGVQTPIPMEKFTTLKEELQKRSVAPGVLVTAVLQNKAQRALRVVISLYGASIRQEASAADPEGVEAQIHAWLDAAD